MYAIIFHAHQKLDRVARRHLNELIGESYFPSIKKILHFEAGHGPDSARLKRQKQGEQPWHFVDPHDEKDTELGEQIVLHYKGLVKSLAERDEVRSAFEAAWLAHALVDGLTPAHHYPYEQELAELRGEARHTRKGLAGRLYVKSDTISGSVKQSFKLVGPKGLLTNHAMFEAGAYSLIAPLSLTIAKPNEQELAAIKQNGILLTFKNTVHEVYNFKIYEQYSANGWTRALSRDVRRELAPRMVKMITLAWYAASQEAAGL